MGKPGKSTGGAKPDDAAKTPPPPPEDDECYEDGDMATPKLDRYGNDDEPL